MGTPQAQVFYTHRNNHSTFHPATSQWTSPANHTHSTQAVADWSKAETTPSGTLVDSAPPAYDVALRLPKPSSKSEDPPPYPG